MVALKRIEKIVQQRLMIKGIKKPGLKFSPRIALISSLSKDFAGQTLAFPCNSFPDPSLTSFKMAGRSVVVIA